ncbi:MAG: DUF2007 domain-containing protein [Myxococcales bacterium]
MTTEPGPISSDAWITIATLTDPVEAEMLEELLRNEGIPVAMPGLQHRAMLGVLGGYVSIPVQVPVRESQRARELLAAFRGAPGSHEEPNESSADTNSGATQAEPATPVRSAKAAAGVAMLGTAVLGSVGAGHLYMRQYAAAAALFVLGWITVISLFAGANTWPGLPLLVFVDIVGAASIARSQSRGETENTYLHASVVIVMAVAAMVMAPWLSSLLARHVETPPAMHGPTRNVGWDGRTR